MDIDLPNSLAGEVTSISQLLAKHGFKVNFENVFLMMKLKKALLNRYNETESGKRSKVSYNVMILKEIKPIGLTIPLELLLVDGVILLTFFIASRFLGSFADEAGKIAARRLLGDGPENAKEHNMSPKEYNFIRNQTIILMEEENSLVLFDGLQREENHKNNK
jgi:hypothetical protein